MITPLPTILLTRDPPREGTYRTPNSLFHRNTHQATDTTSLLGRRWWRITSKRTIQKGSGPPSDKPRRLPFEKASERAPRGAESHTLRQKGISKALRRRIAAPTPPHSVKPGLNYVEYWDLGAEGTCFFQELSPQLLFNYSSM